VVERRTRIEGTERATTVKWFNYAEFDSPDDPGSGHNMDADFLEMLDEARSRAGIPFVITSGFRTDEHNAELGGANDSSHLKGCAADIFAYTSRDRFLILTSLLEAGFDRIGIGEDFIHVDSDWEKSGNLVWTYY
jgi:hypothetical protein